MVETIALVLGGLVVVMAANAVAQRSGLPASVLLVVAGIAYGFLPGTNLPLDPHVVLYVVIPPLLYAAALESSLTALRNNARTVIGLSVGLVLATALIVGAGLNAVVATIPLAVGIAIGAAVAPPDPVAALSIGRRAGLSPRLITLVEGEGLLNDATALTILQVAVAAAVSGSFSVGHAVGQFLLVAAGGLACGAIAALLIARVRALITDPLIDNVMSLATPFAVYLVAEELHTSGVLAVVVAGLWLGHRSPSLQSSRARLQTRAVWHLVEFLLEGYVFVLIGQQLPAVIRGLGAYSTGTIVSAAAVTVGTVLLVRPLWLLVSAHLPARMHARLGGDPQGGNPPLSGRELLALSWAGTRGVITLAAAFTLPATTPARDLLLFCAYLVVLVTLIGQGLTFAPLVRRLNLPGTQVIRALTRNQARAAAVRAALERLTELSDADPELQPVITPLRRAAEARHKRYTDRVALLSSIEDETLPVNGHYHAALHARREMIAAEREELLAWRDAGRLSDADMRILERELDHEESILPAPQA
ncbi:cation:proton antiporter [Planosporangium mesophilum]|uniref:Na+/H+ antiporter n=1 Tax=Planosporangium mesophilum TaxID=689768 RepID=A0A8J3TFE3_9ACTN|nr:sodium:proton antiporter [Planosporangium mesophilum]NJC86324.1 sodium:proton antiporter [Planosporangium mesophilum]GII25883.1 Na+/H+ antiporter [Planosporangium mesophilum]